MKIPKKLKILGYDYEVCCCDRNKEKGVSDGGAQSIFHQKIWIDNQKHKQYQESTVIHEIVEAINAHLNIGLTEQNICQLETGLYQVLNDNGLLK